MNAFRPIHAPTRRAFSLIEAAIVLGIIGLVIGGIWAAAAATSDRHRESNAKRDVLSIVQNLRGLYKGDEEDGNVNDVAIAAKAAPENWINGSTLRDPWGKPVDLLYTSFTGTTCSPSNPVIVVDFQDMSLKACIAMVAWAKSLYPKQVTDVFVGYFDGDGYCGPPEETECSNLFDGNTVRLQLLFSTR